jgi:hypothetical protein
MNRKIKKMESIRRLLIEWRIFLLDKEIIEEG